MSFIKDQFHGNLHNWSCTVKFRAAVLHVQRYIFGTMKLFSGPHCSDKVLPTRTLLIDIKFYSCI